MTRSARRRRERDDHVLRALELFKQHLDELVLDLQDFNRRLKLAQQGTDAGGARRQRGGG